MLKIYHEISVQESLYPNNEVQTYLRKASKQYCEFQQYKLLNDHSFKREDFSLILSHSIKPIFAKPIKQNGIESMKTQDLFKVRIDQDSSTGQVVARNYNDYEAKLIMTLASHYNRYTLLPKSKIMYDQFKWYLRLLENTPIFLVLKHENRLFSENSINQFDKLILDMKRQVTKLAIDKNKLTNSTRSYHFTDLTTYDIFKMAIKSQKYFQNNDDFDSILKTINWNEVSTIKDELITRFSPHNIQEIDSNLHKVKQSEIIDFFKKNRLNRILKDLHKYSLNQVFPYDLQYSSYYVLCIEDSIIEQNHNQLFDLIENLDFEIIASRLSLSNNLINQFFKLGVGQSNPINYETLLKKAQKTSTLELETTMKRLGELGLTHVQQGCHNNCIYLLPEPNPSIIIS